MDGTPPGIRRVCVAIGLDPSAKLSGRAADVRRQLHAALLAACSSSELNRTLLTHQHHGDEQVVLLPAGIDEPQVVASLITGLWAQVRRLNRCQSDGTRLRLTMAIHEGITMLAADGFRGYTIAKTCRLASSEELRAALTTYSAADLIVLLSERIFEDFSRLDSPSLPTRSCQRVEIHNSATEHRDVGWIYIPDQAPDDREWRRGRET